MLPAYFDNIQHWQNLTSIPEYDSTPLDEYWVAGAGQLRQVDRRFKVAIGGRWTLLHRICAIS